MARFLEGLPRRYLILFSQDAIYRHVRLSHDIRPNEAHFFLEKKAEAWELTVVSLDKPFLFSNICGVLAYFGMDILRGHALTSPAGLALDVFQFADGDGFFERNSEGPKEFDRRLREVVSGATDVTALLKSKEGSVLARRSLVRRTPVVHFDTGHSQRYTVLELVADDAPGLLHRVSRVISDHGVDVDLVLISTEGQKAIDVFHITRGGSKLSEGRRSVAEGRSRTHVARRERGEGPATRSMKLIKAIVRPNMVDNIKEALGKLNIAGMTVTEVRGHGRQKGHTAVYRGREYEVSLLPKMEIEVVVPDSAVDEAIKAIIGAARTGEIGDGRVFVMPVEQGYNIRTGEKDV